MENLDKLTATGLPVFDLNTENLERLKPRSVLETLGLLRCDASYQAASGNMDGQGSGAGDSFSGEALSSLKAAVRGRTVKIEDLSSESTILLTTILDDSGSRQGVLAQHLHISTVDKYMPVSDIDKVVSKPARQTKSEGAQQHSSRRKKDGKMEDQADSMQTQLFQRFAELLPNGLAILDSNAEAVFVNDGFFKLTTNRNSKEFRAWPESIHPSDYEQVMSAYRKAFSSREELRVEFRCSSDSAGEEGEWRLFLLRPLNEDPEAGFICAVVDITEIKQAQLTQEKAATEAQDRKEQQERFIDMVSHEIRNPLSAVMHLAEEIKEVAREVQAKHGDQHEYIADILDAADTILLCVSHQNALVDDILSFSKLDSMMLTLVPRKTRPKWEFSKALKVFGSEFKAKNIQFHYAMDVSYENNGVDYVVADLNRMNQVLVNLITNAIKFTSKKKGERKITVAMGASVERPTSYPPDVVFFSDGTESFQLDSTISAEWGTGPSLYLMVAVKDTGIGISVENQVKLFERFRQATPKTQENYGGSGLGLFISRKLTEIHGGDIGVSSKEGEGSTFGFFFRVRRSDGSSEDGRPPFSSRSVSETSTASQQKQSSRPGFARSASHLRHVQQSRDEDFDADPTKERPAPHTVASHGGIDADTIGDVSDGGGDDSLNNPPTEHRDEAHPSASENERYAVTHELADKIKTQESSATDTGFRRGESKRQAKIAEDLSRSHSNEPSKSRPTLLLVEDNLINQKVLRRQLQSRGYEVSVASNGQEAVDAVEARGQMAEKEGNGRNYFDCILMDQEMPIKDGNAATEEIRDLQAQGKAGRSPILGVSANVREEQTDGMIAAGMDAVISKPFAVQDLEAKIKTLLPKAEET